MNGRHRPSATTARSDRAGHVWHLVKRFVGSLSTAPPPATDDQWAASHLGQGERSLWHQMSNPDRRHAIGVARAVVAQLGPEARRPVVAAALLHDSGKVVSGLGTLRRVGATVLWSVLDHGAAHRWIEHDSTVKRKLGQYRLHPELGADLLHRAGADPLTVAWAREHHLARSSWTVPRAVADVLKACDDD